MPRRGWRKPGRAGDTQVDIINPAYTRRAPSAAGIFR
jgi:hypothetical protein